MGGLGVFDPCAFELVLGVALGLEVDTELAGSEILGQRHGGGEVLFVVGFLVDEIELPAFAWNGVVEGSRVEHGAFGEGFDDGKAVVEDGSLEHLVHVLHVGGMGAGDEGRAAANELRHGVDGTVDGSPWIGLGLAANRGGGRGLVLGQTIDEVVHHHVGEIDVFPRGMGQVVASNGVAVTVTAKDEDMQIGAGKREAGGEREGSSVDEVNPVGVHEIRETRGTTDPCDADHFLVIEAELLHDIEERSEHREVSTRRAPSGVIGLEFLLGQFFRFSGGGHD